MEYVCDAPNNLTWFRLVTEGEAIAESLEMRHAVEKHYRRERERAAETFHPTIDGVHRAGHQQGSSHQAVDAVVPDAADEDGKPLVTAMLPPKGKGGGGCIIVGPGNADPYPEYGAAIAALGSHFGITLDRTSCYPYRR